MPATVVKIAGKPVAVVTYYGRITVDDARSVFAQVAALVKQHGAPLYRITQVDCDNARVSFDEVMMLTVIGSKGIPGSVTDRRVKTVLVGEHVLIDLFVDAMRQAAFGGVDIPLFDTMVEARRYVKKRLLADGLLDEA